MTIAGSGDLLRDLHLLSFLLSRLTVSPSPVCCVARDVLEQLGVGGTAFPPRAPLR